MDLFDLTAKITLDTSGYEQGVNSAAQSGSSLEQSMTGLGNAASDAGTGVDQLGNQTDSTSSKFDAIAVAVGNFVASALQQLISKAGEAIQQIVQLGTETETAFAKLQTIADQQYFDGLTNDLRDLSVQSGVSAADLADVAYNAISAGTDTKDAMTMVETATKLGVAGFTESSSALSVLSTAMNSYGDTCGSVEEISDSLIMTQNLGVTTVDDLAKSIGRVIGTGSAYGVSLQNIEAGYVALTKSGLSTQIATTYLSSAISELGDSGSTVAGILQEQTGESFASLMEQGTSLGDIMKTIYEAVDEDNTAFLELWSSSTAGVAAIDIVNQGFDSFNDTLDKLCDSAGATDTAYDIMASTLEFRTNQMEQGFNSLGLMIFDCFSGQMGDAVDFVNDTFIPSLMGILNGSTDIWTATEDIFSEGTELITETLQNIIASLPDLIFGIAEFLIASSGEIMEAGLEMLAGIVDAIPEFIDNFLTELPEFITSTIDYLASNQGDILQAGLDLLMSIVEAIPQVIESLTTNLPEIITAIVSGLINAVPQVLEGGIQLLSGVVQAIPTVVSTLVASLPQITMAILNALVSAVPEVLSGAVDLLGNIITAIPQVAAELPGAMADVISGIVNGLLGGVGQVLNAAMELGSNILSGIKGFLGIASPSTVMEEQGEYITEGLVQGITGMPAEIEGILGQVESYIESWGSGLATNMLDTASNMAQSFITMLQEIPTQTQTILSETLAATTSWGAEMLSQAQSTATEFVNAFNTQVSQLPSQLTGQFNSILSNFASFSSSWTSSASTTTNTVMTTFTSFGTEWASTTAETTTNVLTTFQTFFESLSTAFTENLTNIQTSITTFHTEWSTATTTTTGEILTTVTTFLSNMATQFTTTLGQIKTDITTWGGTLKSEFETIGKNAMDGLVAGLESGSGAVYSKVREIARRMVSEMESELSIASPSKVFRDEIGLMVGEGLAKGIEKSESYVDSAMDNLLSIADVTDQMSRSIKQYSGGSGVEGRGVTVIQNIYSQAQTAADLMREARHEQQRALLMGA